MYEIIIILFLCNNNILLFFIESYKNKKVTGNQKSLTNSIIDINTVTF